MIATSKLTRKNQTTIPKAVLEVLGVKPGSQLLYEVQNGEVRLRARSGRLVDLLRKPPLMPPPKRPLTTKEMRDAVAEAVAGDYERKFGRPKVRRDGK
jgi:AbrB family looped-hinge helix DNA binding protein